MTRPRIALIALLVWAAYWAALPWIDCARVMYAFGSGLQICTVGFQLAVGFGFPSVPNGPPAWGYWPNLLFGLVFLVAAVLVARRRTPI
jgi:MYXO-CTERM domain-containing protein